MAPASQLLGICRSPAWRVPLKCNDTGQLVLHHDDSGICLSPALHLPACQLHGICHSNAWHMPVNCMAAATHLYIICHLTTWHLPVTLTSSAVSTLGLLQAVEAVAEQVQRHQVSALVVDPVLVATSGDSLAGSEVAQALKTHLFPLATVITPNLPEASALLGGQPVDDLDSMKQVSRL